MPEVNELYLKNRACRFGVFDDQAADSCWSLAMDVAGHHPRA